MNNSGSKVTSSFDSKCCYRLYAGHSNWINLDAKTTQDLLKIFQKGDPCRYQLEPGLFIDIIPNDVDCNSKNIDMIGLMRADLVYDSQQSENQVQQQMSHYVRSLLDDQGIIDAFPPLRKGEDLPVITTIPTHRHLSLVPSVVGSVRRGPKSNQMHSHSLNNSKNPSSASSVNEDNHSILSSSSSLSTLQGSFVNSRKKNTPSKRTTKRTRHLDYDSTSKRQLITLGSPNMVNTSFVTHCSPMLNLKSFDEPHYHHHGQSMIPLDFHHQQQQQQQQQEESQSDSNNFWTTSSTYQHSPLYSQSRTSHNFPFGMDLDYPTMQHPRQSPTDILNEYNHSFPFHGEHGMQSYPSSMITHPVTDSENDSSKIVMQQSKQSNGHFVSSDTNSLESFVPTSPIQTWLDDDKNKQQEEHGKTNNGRWVSNDYQQQKNVNDKNIVKTEEYFTDNMTTLPVIERLILQQDSNHTNNIMISHANREENSHSGTMSSP